MPKLRNVSNVGFTPGLSQLRVRHSTAELPRSTQRGQITDYMLHPVAIQPEHLLWETHQGILAGRRFVVATIPGPTITAYDTASRGNTRRMIWTIVSHYECVPPD